MADDAGDVPGYRGAGGIRRTLLDGRANCLLVDEPRLLDVSSDFRAATRTTGHRAVVASLVVLAVLLVRIGRPRRSTGQRVDVAILPTGLLCPEDAGSQRLAAIVGLLFD